MSDETPLAFAIGRPYEHARRASQPANMRDAVQKPPEGRSEPAEFATLVDAIAALLALAGKRNLAEPR
jgi:hypothetical protein